MGLPTLIALKSVTIKKYLIHKDEHIQTLHDIVQSYGKDGASPNAKFQLMVYEDNSDLVHIKSFHNGNYWTRADPNNFLIVAGASKQQKDRNDCTCTRLKHEEVVQPQPDNQNLLYRFHHVQLGYFIEPFSGTSFHALLNAHQPTPTDKQIFVVIDKETLG